MRTAILLSAGVGLVAAAAIEKRQDASSTTASSVASSIVSSDTTSTDSSTSVPQWFQTSPELYAGPTPTGQPAFLAQTNPAPFPGKTYIPPAPLETQVPIQGAPADGNIFQLHGQLSHYFPNPVGFGVDEFSLPAGANISQLHMLSRHGSRYPTSTPGFVAKLTNRTLGNFTASGQLAFLNDWTYKLGQQILVPVGKQELFDSGTLHQYMYGHLYPNNGSKIVARSTTQDRMTQSAEYFLAGFFGLGWPQNASLELIIEQPYYNNSLAGYFQCNNSNNGLSAGGTNASVQWQQIYLQDATKRIQAQIQPSNYLNISDVYNMQSICAYETVALGYSAFCDLFTYEEWQGYEYSVDLSFAGNDAFQSPTGRAVGIGYVQEIRARLTNHYLTEYGGSANLTLDGMASTFPLGQALNFDFSHDTNIMSILTAFGLTQFATYLPPTHIVPRDLIVSHMEPFGARLDIEIIKAPKPVSATRSWTQGPCKEDDYVDGEATSYVHFILNQRTIPLGRSYDACGNRTDGWCELSAFLDATADAYNVSDYDFACNGNYAPVPYGTLDNGVPQTQPNSTFNVSSYIYRRDGPRLV